MHRICATLRNKLEHLNWGPQHAYSNRVLRGGNITRTGDGHVPAPNEHVKNQREKNRGKEKYAIQSYETLGSHAHLCDDRSTKPIH
jgi:hypothetical protein